MLSMEDNEKAKLTTKIRVGDRDEHKILKIYTSGQAHTIYNNYKKSKITSQKEEGADSFRIVDSPRGVNSNEKERENRRKRDEDGRFRVRFTWRPLTLSFLSFSLCVPQALLKREIK